MPQILDRIDHIAIKVQDIHKAVDWYTQHLKCEVMYQDDTWGLLKFENISLALILPDTHPAPHIGIPTQTPEKYGNPKPHRDGTSSVYLPDPFGNYIEMIKLRD